MVGEIVKGIAAGVVKEKSLMPKFSWPWAKKSPPPEEV